jgi:hypothetical protein
VSPQPDRRSAIFPDPPEPGPEQQDFPPNPRRLGQPNPSTGKLEGGQQARGQGMGPATIDGVPAGSQPYTEGRELRPPGVLPSGPAFVIRHEHHHIVETREKGAVSTNALRFTIPGDGNVHRLLPRDSNRYRATILNLATTATNQVSSPACVTIGPTHEISATGQNGVVGFDLVPGASQDHRGLHELWASCPSGSNGAVVCIWENRYSPDPGDGQS